MNNVLIKLFLIYGLGVSFVTLPATAQEKEKPEDMASATVPMDKQIYALRLYSKQAMNKILKRWPLIWETAAFTYGCKNFEINKLALNTALGHEDTFLREVSLIVPKNFLPKSRNESMEWARIMRSIYVFEASSWILGQGEAIRMVLQDAPEAKDKVCAKAVVLETAYMKQYHPESKPSD